MTSRLQPALDAARDRAAATIARAIGRPDLPVAEAMLYACEGGKGLRAFLVLEGAALHGVAPDAATPAAAAVEAIHAYSLVHDDLPSMDDDDLRRGRPTVHRAWDEATAILAGDALQALAFGMLAKADAPPEARVRLIATLANAAGLPGMVGGQALDIAAETVATPLNLDAITALQRRKTGALLEWSAAAGPRLAGADDAALLAYGTALGQAFQIADGGGKATGKDAGRGKATFVTLLGLDGARARAMSLIDEAIAALDPYGPEADTLREAARFVLDRRK